MYPRELIDLPGDLPAKLLSIIRDMGALAVADALESHHANIMIAVVLGDANKVANIKYYSRNYRGHYKMRRPRIDAKLHDWMLFRNTKADVTVLVGRISGDKKKRYTSGTLIMTSPIHAGQVVREGSIIRTQNSVYLLGNPNTQENDFEGSC